MASSLPAPPWLPQQTLQWDGRLNNPGEPHQHLTFTVLAGLGGPVPTGGWAQVNTIGRARRLGFTQVSGYDPLSMDVPIRFYSATQYRNWPLFGQTVEDQIQRLEWMAGRGKLYANGSHPTEGNPPLVQVSSFIGKDTTDLIPPNFASAGPHDLRWLISAISYDSSTVMRDVNGSRTFQDATVSLTQYAAAPGAPTSTQQRQTGRGGSQSVTVRSKQGQSFYDVCRGNGYGTAAQAFDVLKYNLLVGNRLPTRSIHKVLPVGTQVVIPAKGFSLSVGPVSATLGVGGSR